MDSLIRFAAGPLEGAAGLVAASAASRNSSLLRTTSAYSSVPQAMRHALPNNSPLLASAKEGAASPIDHDNSAWRKRGSGTDPTMRTLSVGLRPSSWSSDCPAATSVPEAWKPAHAITSCKLANAAVSMGVGSIAD